MSQLGLSKQQFSGGAPRNKKLFSFKGNPSKSANRKIKRKLILIILGQDFSGLFYRYGPHSFEILKF